MAGYEWGDIAEFSPVAAVTQMHSEPNFMFDGTRYGFEGPNRAGQTRLSKLIHADLQSRLPADAPVLMFPEGRCEVPPHSDPYWREWSTMVILLTLLDHPERALVPDTSVHGYMLRSMFEYVKACPSEVLDWLCKEFLLRANSEMLSQGYLPVAVHHRTKLLAVMLNPVATGQQHRDVYQYMRECERSQFLDLCPNDGFWEHVVFTVGDMKALSHPNCPPHLRAVHGVAS